jgi:hypothetical protein
MKKGPGPSLSPWIGCSFGLEEPLSPAPILSNGRSYNSNISQNARSTRKRPS